METVSDFIFLGSKITADGDCSHEITRCLLLGRKVLVNIEQHLLRTWCILNAQFCVRLYPIFKMFLIQQTYTRQTLITSATVSRTSCFHSSLANMTSMASDPTLLHAFSPVFLFLKYPQFYQCNTPISTCLSSFPSSSSCSDVLCSLGCP